MARHLVERLMTIGIEPAAVDDASEVFELLVERFGGGATLDDRLALEAHVLGVPVDALPPADRRRAVEHFYGLRWDGFEIVGSPRNDPVDIVEYDPSWPERFRRWREVLQTALGSAAVRIEHVGSTAVPGLAAKPIIDIQISVADLDDEASYVPQIEAAGVALRSRDAEHRYFRPAPGRPRDVQVHVCVAGGAWERDHVRFRDHLRANPAARRAYADLKRRLAARHVHDRLAYTEGKNEFVERALRARTDGASEPAM